MKKKSKKPKDELINHLLEDLKLETSEPSGEIDINEGLEGLHPDSDSKTDVIGVDKPQAANKNSTLSPASNRDRISSHSNKESSKASSSMSREGETLTHERTILSPHQSRSAAVEPKSAFGGSKGKTSPFEAQFAQAENMRMAQQRILQLERDVEELRKENELLSSANEVSKQKFEELISKVHQLERQKHDLKETNESELRIFKDGLASKDHEIHRLQSKVDELENRLATDLRKVRVRERELENRLELAKAEKTALIRAKDETILELKRKTDNLESEQENYQNKIIEMGQRLENNQDQFARTVRALRIALTNLEVSDSTNPSITIAPLKKAE